MNTTKWTIDYEYNNKRFAWFIPMQCSVTVQAESKEKAEEMVTRKYGHLKGFRIVNVR